MIEVEIEEKHEFLSIFRTAIFPCIIIGSSGALSLVSLIHLHSIIFNLYSELSKNQYPYLNFRLTNNRERSDIAIKINTGNYSQHNKVLEIKIIPIKDQKTKVEEKLISAEIEIADNTLNKIAEFSELEIPFNFSDDIEGSPLSVMASLENITEPRPIYLFLHIKGNALGIDTFQIIIKTVKEQSSKIQDDIVGFSISIAIVATCIHIVFAHFNTVLIVSVFLFILIFTQIRFFNSIIFSLIVCSYRALFAVYAVRSPKGNAWTAELSVASIVLLPSIIFIISERSFIEAKGMDVAPISQEVKRSNDWAIAASLIQGIFDLILYIASLFVNSAKDSTSTTVLFAHAAVLFYSNIKELFRRGSLYGIELQFTKPQETLCDRKYTALGSLIMILIALSPQKISLYDGNRKNNEEQLLWNNLDG